MIVSTLHPTRSQDLRILPIDANWDQSVRLSYIYKTDIITSGNGKEQRRAVRFYPRKEMQFSAVFWGEAKTALDMHMAKYQNVRSIIPEWPFRIKTAAPLRHSDLQVKVVGDMSWLSVGMLVVLINGQRRETRTVAGFSDTIVRFTESADDAFPETVVEDRPDLFDPDVPVGTSIYPALTGYIQTDPAFPRRIRDAGTSQLVFLCDPQSVVIANTPPLFTLNATEIVLERPNWSQDVQLSFVQPRETVDYDFGVVAQFLPNAFSARTIQAGFWGPNPAHTKRMLDLFCRHRGRLGQFWLPTFENDIPYYQMTGNGLSILIHGLTFADAYAESSVFRRLMIRMRDGRFLHRKVDFIEGLPDTNTSVVWLTEALPNETFDETTVLGVSWVLAARFASDRLDIDYLTDGVTQFSFSFQTLENFEL